MALCGFSIHLVSIWPHMNFARKIDLRSAQFWYQIWNLHESTIGGDSAPYSVAASISSKTQISALPLHGSRRNRSRRCEICCHFFVQSESFQESHAVPALAPVELASLLPTPLSSSATSSQACLFPSACVVTSLCLSWHSWCQKW